MNGQRRFTVITSVLLLTVGLLGAAKPSVAVAKDYPTVTLTSTSDTASWSGEFSAGAFGVAPVVAVPEACTPQLCDIVPLDVQLPEKTWQQRPGGMLVAIQSPVLDLFAYDLDVFIYAPGCTPVECSPVASSGFGFGEAAWGPQPCERPLHRGGGSQVRAEPAARRRVLGTIAVRGVHQVRLVLPIIG